MKIIRISPRRNPVLFFTRWFSFPSTSSGNPECRRRAPGLSEDR
ncbi:Uncharacterized protein dnm_061520 [Desulfonema magnum]|uniref:Uncharacterized protein n=1 Tax=Desulfonema magnum TaxID=45655 RepID=A0A975BR03_9BACT|nr:Uncharacterized protein dnm_061520 [Desulfonema magnum]